MAFGPNTLTLSAYKSNSPQPRFQLILAGDESEPDAEMARCWTGKNSPSDTFGAATCAAYKKLCCDMYGEDLRFTAVIRDLAGRAYYSSVSDKKESKG